MVVILFEIEERPEPQGPDYKAASGRMNDLVRSMPGFISSDDYTGEDGKELSIVRFESPGYPMGRAGGLAERP